LVPALAAGEFTVIIKVVVVAHWPNVGVKVYVVVVVLSNAGDQVPVIPSIDVVGNADRLAPEQIGATAVNVGVTVGLTVTVTVNGSPAQPAALIGVIVYTTFSEPAVLFVQTSPFNS
jgi:hypothetical protein